MKYPTLFLLGTLFMACSRDIPIEPINNANQALPQPDYNFLSTPAYPVVYRNEAARYVMPVQLYLRPFEHVTDSTQFVLLYDSDKYAQLVMLGDTLFPGDKKRVRYGEFINHRLVAVYTTQTAGNHNVKLAMSARQVTKDSNFQFRAE